MRDGVQGTLNTGKRKKKKKKNDDDDDCYRYYVIILIKKTNCMTHGKMSGLLLLKYSFGAKLTQGSPAVRSTILDFLSKPPKRTFHTSGRFSS